MTDKINKTEYIVNKWEHVNCMFCGSNEYKFYEKFGYKLRYTHVKCKNCGLIYQSPRPKYDDDFIDAAYGKYFELDKNFNYDKKLAPGTKKHKNWTDELNEILCFDKNRSAVLDVGCGMGQFLYFAKNEYKKTEGIDMSKAMADLTAQKLGISVYSEQFHSFNTENKYSTLHLSHVIEHIPNPIEWLNKCKQLLTEDGVIMIAVPNMRSISRMYRLLLKKLGIFSGAWKEAWRTPDHLFEPTPKSLKQFVLNNGFEILTAYTYSRSDSTSKKLINKILYRKLMLGSNIRIYIKPKK